jgi:hypothetical protein
MKHIQKTKSQRKAQAGPLEDGKTAKLAHGTKSGKTSKIANKG